jgi:L-ascorbate metabolism protein UlaG (beta-lactamase superfamily)
MQRRTGSDNPLMPIAAHLNPPSDSASLSLKTRRCFIGVVASAVLMPSAARGAPVEPALKVQRLGWAGIRLQLGTSNLYIDPLINLKVWGAALPGPLPPIETQPGDRYVLVTHRHPDHFDPLAVQAALGDNGLLLSADVVGALPAPVGARSRTVALYEPQILGDFTVMAVPAADGYGDPQVSWIVSGGGRRIIHCGDTLWHGHWWKYGRQYGPFDVAFLPINGAKFGWRKPLSDVAAVMTPQQAIGAAAVIGARLVVPIHYGVAPSAEYLEMTDVEAELIKAARTRGIGVEIVVPGAWVTWKAKD